MEEQILKILYNSHTLLSTLNLETNEQTDEYKFDYESAAKEIADTFKRFIEWLMSGNDGTYMQSHISDEKLMFLTDINEPYATLDDVFKYWSEVIDQKEN